MQTEVCTLLARVISTSPANSATEVAVNVNLTINFNQVVIVTEPWFEMNCDGKSLTAVVSGGPQNYSLDPITDFAPIW